VYPSLLSKLNQSLRPAQNYAWDGIVRSDHLAGYLRNPEPFEAARREFFSHDAVSLSVFDWVIGYRAVTSFFPTPPYELPGAPFSKAEWAELERRAEAMTEGFAKGDYILDRIDVWLLQSYALPRLCEAEPGDTVLDCGAYTGNTSLYFSQKVGPTGRVYGFEPGQSFMRQYVENVSALDNITPVPCAVSDHSGPVSFYTHPANDAGSSIVEDKRGDEVTAVSLDDFVRLTRLRKVDFIKMDIEGAEGAALRGAKDIILAFHPKMAISAYHKSDDIYALPQLIRSIRPEYTFYLRHYSDHLCETVLFCIPEAPKSIAMQPQDDAGQKIELRELLDILLTMMRIGCSASKNGYSKAITQAGAVLSELKKAYSAALVANTRLTEMLERALEENKRLAVENKVIRKTLEKIEAQKQTRVCA
jgi:FkbM family methyltransferase